MIVYLSCGFLGQLAELPITYDDWSPSHDHLWWLTCSWVQGVMGEPVCWQRMPTIRRLSTGEVGYPLHRETDFGHSAHTTNLWAAMCRTEAGAITVEGHELAPMSPGDCCLFPGNDLHGSPGASQGPRVSIDARFLPLRLYAASEERSRVLGMPLRLGAYYGHPDELLTAVFA